MSSKLYGETTGTRFWKKTPRGLLQQRMEEVVDGQYQKYTVESGEYIRRDFFGTHPDLLKMVEHLSDEQLQKLRRGGHDPEKVYAAFKAAVEHKGAPTVILAKTIKGLWPGRSWRRPQHDPPAKKARRRRDEGI